MSKELILLRALGLLCVFASYVLLTFLGDVLARFHAASSLIDSYSSYRMVIWYGVTLISALYCISVFRLNFVQTIIVSGVIFWIAIFGLDYVHAALIPDQSSQTPGNNALYETWRSAAFEMALFVYGAPYFIIWILSFGIVRWSAGLFGRGG